MSKKSGSAPTQGETNFVSTVLLRGEAPLYIKWVTKRKRDKVQDRLIVVGKYRIFSIKKTLTGKKQVQRVGHLFDLVAINSGDVDKVIFKFKDFDIDIQEPGAGTELIQVVRTAFQRISCSFAEYATPKITLVPAERQLPTLPQIDFGLAHGVLATYEAFCDYYNLPPSQEFMKYITDVANSGSTELVLEQCPGVDRKENPLNFIPVRAALRHNTYFTAFILRNIPRKDIGLAVADTLLHNVTLERIVLSGVETPDTAFIAIGTALRKNPYNRLTSIDFSETSSMKDKGAIGLADGIQTLNHGLLKLNLAACGIGTKGISAIFQALAVSKEASSTLMDLDVAHNNIGQPGSLAMANWLNQDGCGNRLKYLMLRNTKLDVAPVMKAIKNGQVCTICELDISGNKIDSPGGQAVAVVVETNPELKLLNIANCGLLHGPAMAIISALTSSQQIQGVTLNISENSELGPTGANAIAQILTNTTNMSTILMSNCGFKKEGMLKLAEALGSNSTLQGIDVSYNLHTGSASKMLHVVKTLADSVGRHPKLQHLAIKGDCSKMSVGTELKPLLEVLAQNPSITELDITGNRIGDQLAVTLADSLRQNNKLKSLLYDQNNVNIGGWQALVNILGQNTTLVNCPPPRNDMEKAVKDSKNKEAFAVRLKECIDNLQAALKQNSGGSAAGYSSEFESKKKGRSYTVRPAYQTLRPGAIPQGTFSNPSTQGEYALMPDSPQASFVRPNPSSYGSSPPDSYMEQPPPPPPRYEDSNSYSGYTDTADLPPPVDAFEYEKAYAYENDYAQEYDDTAYESAPPPPPPPPF